MSISKYLFCIILFPYLCAGELHESNEKIIIYPKTEEYKRNIVKRNIDELKQYYVAECPYDTNYEFLKYYYNRDWEGLYFKGYLFFSIFSRENPNCKGWNLYAFDTLNKQMYFVKNSTVLFEKRILWWNLFIFGEHLILKEKMYENPEERSTPHFFEVGTPILRKIDIETLEITDSVILLKDGCIDSMYIQNGQIHIITEELKPVVNFWYYIFFFIRERPYKLKEYERTGLKVEYIFDEDFKLLNTIETND